MREFLKLIARVTLGCVVILVALELYSRSLPSVYRDKAEYMHAHASEIETLVLGPSLMMNGISPKEFKKEGFNLAFPMQSPMYDWIVLTKDSAQLKNLKTVLYSASSFDKTLQDLPWGARYRVAYYCQFFDYKKGVIFDREVWEVGQLPQLMKKISKASNSDMIKGWIQEKNTFNEWRFNLTADAYYAKMRKLLEKQRNINQQSSYVGDTRYIDSIFQFCERRNVRVIVLNLPQNPVVADKFAKIAGIDENSNREYIDSYVRKYKNVTYKDYSKDKNIDVTDFADEQHLNVMGARKFSKKLQHDLDL